LVLDHPNLLIERLSEEHATVKVIDGATSLEPGDRVRIVPNHSCPGSNLTERAWIVEGPSTTLRPSDAVEALPIAARGRNS
jgi:D-serine deaminase-like pyridoxal phosphate-dependent protein